MARKGSSLREDSETEKLRTSPETKKISFDTWFGLRSGEPFAPKPWQRRELQTFFREIGLSDSETRERYDSAFKRY